MFCVAPRTSCQCAPAGIWKRWYSGKSWPANGRRPLLIIHVRNTLEEEQGKDGALEVGSVHGAAQDVGRFPEVGFELGEGDRLLRHVVSLFLTKKDHRKGCLVAFLRMGLHAAKDNINKLDWLPCYSPAHVVLCGGWWGKTAVTPPYPFSTIIDGARDRV